MTRISDSTLPRRSCQLWSAVTYDPLRHSAVFPAVQSTIVLLLLITPIVLSGCVLSSSSLPNLDPETTVSDASPPNPSPETAEKPAETSVTPSPTLVPSVAPGLSPGFSPDHSPDHSPNLSLSPNHRGLSLRIVSDSPAYDTLEATIVDLNDSIELQVIVQPASSSASDTSAPRHYQILVTSEAFSALWRDLQALQVDILPDASANDPDPEQPGLLRSVSDAPLYQFRWQEAEQPLHQFQVYGPNFVADRRYQALVTRLQTFLETSLGQPLDTL